LTTAFWGVKAVIHTFFTLLELKYLSFTYLIIDLQQKKPVFNKSANTGLSHLEMSLIANAKPSKLQIS
jgi:hypothetical protein